MTTSVPFKSVSLDEMTFPELFRIAIKDLAKQRGIEPDKNLWLREDPKNLHKRLLELQVELQEQLPPLQSIHFLTAGPFPYSSEVAQTLDLLQRANAISRENPSYQRFSPKIFQDTYPVVEKEIDVIFRGRDNARKAFDQFVKGLSTLVAER